MWTGWVGNDGSGNGPVVDNAEAGYDWSTFPELLEKAGISWKIYQDVGEGLDAAHFWGWTGDDPYIGNYGDNSLLYFFEYQNAPDASPLAQRARTGTNILKSGTLFDAFRKDVVADQLPQVSWVVAPEAYTEHPNWPANYGAWYVSKLLDALTANPDVWSKTVFIIMYDENDGFFDHMVPPTPPQSSAEGRSTIATSNEIFPGSAAYAPGPYGFGVRVPMIIVSPWSKGGWVCSQVFDHTSLIRFVERRFGGKNSKITESNITVWRRAVAGDLTSAFNFASPNDAQVALPSTIAYAPPDNVRHPDYTPTVPIDQAMPAQEHGTRPARALPYELQVDGSVDPLQTKLQLSFRNTGSAAAVFHARAADGLTGPWSYTVGAGDSLDDTFTAAGAYDISVYGPNGFLRRFAGRGIESAALTVQTVYDRVGGGIALVIRNNSWRAVNVTIADAYSNQKTTHLIQAHDAFTFSSHLSDSLGWYDFLITADSMPSFARHLAGHVETGRDGVTDPAIGAVRAHEAVDVMLS
jgi:phospholipase C